MTRYALSILCLMSIVSACKTTVKTLDACGDGFLDPGEQCDGSSLPVTACSDMGYHLQSGPITCNADCTLNLTVCSGRCGDGVLERDAGEHCDGSDLDGQSCQSLDMGGGSLGCNDRCRFDASGCEVSAVCGDGTLHAPFEDCEGQDLQGATCETLGYYGGQLGCDQDCQYDLASCRTYGRCGDGVIQTLYGEACEGSGLQEQTCEGLGYYGGQLLCGVDCTYDESGCSAVGRCGDGVIQAGFGEACDGDDLGGFSCAEDTNYHAGEAVCNENCRLDLSACEATGTCGDGVLQVAYEGCDGALFPGNPSCTLLGYHGNNQGCTADCTPDLSPCIASGRCGDGIRQQMYEACEGSDLANNDCPFFDFYGSGLSCNGDCTYSLTVCEANGYCGDGVIQTTFGELCDGENVGANTCESAGYPNGGVLRCNDYCQQFDTSGCTPD